MKGTKEYYEMIASFEKFAKQSADIKSCCFDKASDAPASVIYEDGYTNAMFHCYMVGYQHGRMSV